MERLINLAGSESSAVVRLRDPVRGVAVWRCDLQRFAADVENHARVLSPGERERAARFGSDALRNRWIAGRAALRALLGDVLGAAPADVPLRRGRRGRPEVAMDAAPDFNVSHTGCVALVAIGLALARDVRIGVDVERRDRDVGADRLARKFLTARERASASALSIDARRERFLRAWTYKEAMSKATADGLIAPFRDLDVDVEAPGLVGGPPPYDPDRWQLVAADPDANHFAAVALWRYH